MSEIKRSLIVAKAVKAHIEHYGPRALEVAHMQLTEEVGELLVALSHHRRERVTKTAVIEEIADVSLIMELILFMLDAGDEAEKIIDQKAERFLQRKLRQERGYRRR